MNQNNFPQNFPNQQQPQGFPNQQPQQPQQQGFPNQQQQQPGFQAQPQQQVNPAALFQGISGTKASVDANYLRPGHYIARIDRIKAGANSKGQTYFATEMTILHCVDGSAAQQAGTMPHAPGEQVTDLKMQHHASFLSNVCAMVSALEGMTDEALKAALANQGSSLEQHCAQLCDPEAQPYAGMFIEISARNITTQAGRPFTKPKYHREVRPSQLQEVLPAEAIQAYFPGESLQNLIAQEQQIHGGGQEQPQMQQGQPQPQQYQQPQ